MRNRFGIGLWRGLCILGRGTGSFCGYWGGFGVGTSFLGLYFLVSFLFSGVFFSVIAGEAVSDVNGWRERVIIVSGDRDYPPYEFLDENGQASGFSVELTLAIAEEMGLEVDYRLDVWGEALNSVIEGRSDILESVIYSESRGEYLIYGSAYAHSAQTIFVRKDSKAVRGIDDLGSAVIIVQKHDIMEDYVRENNLGSRVIRVAELDEALELLSSGEGDCVLASEFAGLYYIGTLGFDNIVTVGSSIVSQDIHYAAAKGNEELLGLFEEGLAKVRRAGIYNSLYEHWLGVRPRRGLEIKRVLKYSGVVISVLLLIIFFAALWSGSLAREVKNQTRELRVEVEERKRTELALRMSEQRFCAIANYTYGWELWVSPNGRILWANSAAERVSGYTSEELTGMKDWVGRLVFIENRSKLYRAMAGARQGSSGKELQFRLIRKDGVVRWCEVSWQEIFDNKGVSQGYRASISDITERKESEDALRISERMRKLVLDTIPVSVFWKDLNSVFLGCNENFAHDAGLESVDEIIGKTDDDMVWETEAELYRRDDGAVISSGEAKINFEEPQTREGTSAILRTSKIPLRDDTGNIIGVLGTYEDITMEKQSREALAESERRLSTMMSNLPGVAYRCLNDADWTMKFMSEGFAALTGHETADIVENFKLSYDELIFSEDRERVHEEVEAALEKSKAFSCEYRILRSDGVIKWVMDRGRQVSAAEDGTGIIEGLIVDITERKRAEQGVVAERDRAQSYLDVASVMLMLLDSRGHIKMMNRKGLEILGAGAKDLVGLDWFDNFILPDFRDRNREQFMCIMSGESNCREYFEMPVLNIWGQERLFSWRTALVRDLDGKVTGLLASGEDITERRAAEDELFESGQKFRAIADYTYDWENWFGSDGKLLWTDPAVERVTGYSVGEASAMEGYPVCLTVEADRERFGSIYYEAVKYETSGQDIEFRIRRKNGRVIWVNASWQPIYDEDGRYLGIRMSIRDVTAMKAAISALAASEERYRLFVENFHGIAYRWDFDYEPEFVSGSVEVITGYDEISFNSGSVKWNDLIHGEDRLKYALANSRMRDKVGKSYELQYRIVNKEGGIRWVQEYVTTITKSGSDSLRMQGSIFDITDRKLVEAEVKNIALFPGENPNQVIRVSDKGVLMYANAASGDLLSSWGISEGSIIPDVWVKMVEEVVVSNEVKYYELSLNVRYFSFTIVPVADHGYCNIYGLDISKRHVAEVARDNFNRELELKNEELESILNIASHDLRAPLVNIQGFSHELRGNCSIISSSVSGYDLDSEARFALDEGVESCLEYILSSTIKMDMLLNGLLRFCRIGRVESRFERINMNELVSGVVKNVEYRLKSVDAEIRVGDLIDCIGDKSQVDQVFSNLIDNALKYLDSDRQGLIQVCNREESGNVIYVIEDNGIGVEASHQEKIFEMFHRLDPYAGKGEGLGLTIVRRLLDRNNGIIWVESEVGIGSSFFVSLPKAGIS
jgi:PAS domain S-box-containing protein